MLKTIAFFQLNNFEFGSYSKKNQSTEGFRLNRGSI